MPLQIDVDEIKPTSFYDKRAFAQFIQKSVFTVDRLVMKRQIKYHRDGGRVLFRGRDILQFLERNAVEAR